MSNNQFRNCLHEGILNLCTTPLLLEFYQFRMWKKC